MLLVSKCKYELKCEFFTHFGSCFVKLHDVSTSHLEALVT